MSVRPCVCCGWILTQCCDRGDRPDAFHYTRSSKYDVVVQSMLSPFLSASVAACVHLSAFCQSEFLSSVVSQLVLVYHLNRQLGIPDELFTFGDDVVLAVLGQLAFMPTLVLAARLCPPGVEGTLFALLMSIFNGGGIVGSELGALLTRVMGVTDVDFRNLGMLIVVCNLSSLLPLPFLKWIDAVETEEAEQLKDGGSLDKQNP